MSGPGKTRIDAVLCNPVAAKLVKHLWYEWELSEGFDHVMLSVEFSIKTFSQITYQLERPLYIDIGIVCNMEHDDLNHRLEIHWQWYDEPYRCALDNDDIEQANIIWNHAMEMFLIGFDPNIREGETDKFPARGFLLPFAKKTYCSFDQ